MESWIKNCPQKQHWFKKKITIIELQNVTYTIHKGYTHRMCYNLIEQTKNTKQYSELKNQLVWLILEHNTVVPY